MRFLIAMDSFKGSLTSVQAGNAVKEGILEALPGSDITVLPLADGGEGTVDAIAGYTGGEMRYLTVTGPLNTPVRASYLLVEKNRTAYIEMAAASGLTLIAEDERNPYLATTFGTGELIRDAIASGVKRLIVCIGGSATNDGGAGILQALGASLKDSDGNDIPRGAIGLKDLSSIDLSGLAGTGLDITVASDVTSPLCGPSGASYVYGPQKGATSEMAFRMDNWLKHFADLAGFDPYEPGTGAAGGISFALKNLMGAEIRSGADIVTEITGTGRLISQSDIVITGEGRMDRQTVNGKAPFKILRLGQRYGKPVIGITGIRGDGYEECLRAGFDRIVPLKDPSMDTTKAVRSLIETTRLLFENYAAEE